MCKFIYLSYYSLLLINKSEEYCKISIQLASKHLFKHQQYSKGIRVLLYGYTAFSLIILTVATVNKTLCT